MTVTLDLTPEQEEALRQKAERLGMDVKAYLRRMVDAETTRAGGPAPGDGTLALLERWDAEDAAMTLEEVDQAEADWQELKAGLNAERAATGERLLFP